MRFSIDSSILKGYSNSQALELELEKSRKIFSLTCEQEESRRLRVDLLFLQEENTELHNALLEKEERVDTLEDEAEEQNALVEALKQSMDNLRFELKNRLKEAERLKTEVDSLQAMANESAKVVEEKLRLARELSNLRPELEHLRAQQTTNANALSDKLALQRELQTLQVELDNERRALQKATTRDEGRSTQEAKLEADLESYKIELAKEKRLREKLEQTGKSAGSQLEAQNLALESRLEDYRVKLKSAKEQIKKERAELEEARKANERLLQGKQRAPAPNRGKRGLSQIDADATIGTPDGFPVKRANRGSALIGERSEFAMTPYIVPSTKLAIETPIAEEPEDNEPPTVDGLSVGADLPSKAKKITTRPTQKPKPNQTKTVKPTVQKKLEQAKETSEDEEVIEDLTVKSTEAAPIATEKPSSQAPIPKKKRRLLGAGSGKTLFDDDDENVSGKVDSRGGLDDFKFAMPKRVKLAPKGATLLGAKGIKGVTSAFGEFSPLKKDRKRV